MDQSNRPGLNPDRIAGTNFIMLHLDLVDDLDGDFLAALLLDRIRFRAGVGWWTATREMLRDDTRLSEHQLKHGLNKLRDMGYVETKRVSAYDPTLMYRVVFTETTVMEDSATTRSGISPPVMEDSAVTVMEDFTITSTKNSEEQKQEHTLVSAEPPRDDVQALCELLVEKIKDNGGRSYPITKAWRDATRLMLDKDGIPYEDVRGAILWSQASEFWRGNILSMPKLREKYDQLRLNALRENKPTNSQAHIALIESLCEDGNGYPQPDTLQLEG